MCGYEMSWTSCENVAAADARLGIDVEAVPACRFAGAVTVNAADV